MVNTNSYLNTKQIFFELCIQCCKFIANVNVYAGFKIVYYVINKLKINNLAKSFKMNVVFKILFFKVYLKIIYFLSKKKLKI